MRDLVAAAAIFCVLIGVQYGMRFQRQYRATRLWKKSTEAIQSGNLAVAEPALRKCVDLLPLTLPVRITLASVLLRLGRLDEAEREFKAVTALQPREAEGHLHLGFFYVAQLPGREAEATAAFGEALRYAPALRQQFQTDPRLEGLRRHPGFKALLAEPVQPG